MNVERDPTPISEAQNLKLRFLVADAIAEWSEQRAPCARSRSHARGCPERECECVFVWYHNHNHITLRFDPRSGPTSSVMASVRKPTLPRRMSEKHTRDAPHGCACSSIGIRRNMPIGVGSSVSTSLNTVVYVAFAVARRRSAELAPPEVRGSLVKYRMMRTDNHQ